MGGSFDWDRVCFTLDEVRDYFTVKLFLHSFMVRNRRDKTLFWKPLFACMMMALFTVTIALSIGVAS